MISALIGVVPWYVWACAIALIVLVSVLQLWPVVFALLRGALALWSKLPADAKIAACVIAGLAGLVVLHLWIVREQVSQAVQEERGRGESRLKAALEAQRAAFQKQIQDARDAGQAALDAMGALLAKEQLDRERERKAREAKHQAELAALKKGFDQYVTPLQLTRCSDVPRGYLVRRANAAAYANGGAESAGPPASAASLDEPSGVSLAALDAVDVEAAGAFRACRDRLIEWEGWGARVDRWKANVQHILQPQEGATP